MFSSNNPLPLGANVDTQSAHLTTVEVANECRTAVETVRYWRHIGYGPPSFKIGRRVLYRREDVDAWLETEYQRQTGTERSR